MEEQIIQAVVNRILRLSEEILDPAHEQYRDFRYVEEHSEFLRSLAKQLGKREIRVGFSSKFFVTSPFVNYLHQPLRSSLE